MKLVMVRFDEVYGFEFTPDELFILNWALSDHCSVMEDSLKNNTEPGMVHSGKSYGFGLSSKRREEIEKRLDVAQRLKAVLELLVY